jgi:hypothetical protein
MMEQRIDLSDLPIYRLRDTAYRNDINLEDLRTKSEIVKRIRERLPESVLSELLKEYVNAGRTGVVWFRYSPTNETEVFINRESLPGLLKALCENENPFHSERTPVITEEPQIVTAEFLPDENIAWILFVKKGIERTVYVDYDRKEICPSDFINTFFHINDGIFEIRHNYQDARVLANIFFKKLNEDNKCIHDYRQIPITLENFERLRERLDAVTDEFLGKDEEPGTIYDTKKYTRSPSCPDLWEEDKFHSDTKMIDPRMYVLIFRIPAYPNITVKATVSIKQGSIYFRTFASETEIRHVYDIFIDLLNLEGNYAGRYYR